MRLPPPIVLLCLASWSGTLARTLLNNLLDEYPNSPGCDLHFVTDKEPAVDNDALSDRAVTLWKLSGGGEISFPTKQHCVLVFVNASMQLMHHFIGMVHLHGGMGQNQFYAIHVQGSKQLLHMNLTEIYDFPNLIFLVHEKVTF